VRLILHVSLLNWVAGPERFGGLLADIAGLAEEGGFDGIAIADHMWQHPMMGGPEADCLEVCTRMWSGRGDRFTGNHIVAERLLNVPQALQRPRPGILVPGGGEVRTLALVARYGDACSLRPGPEIPHKLDVLRHHCDTAGTDFERIERTCAYAFDPDDGGPATRGLIDRLTWLADLGIDTIIGRVDGDDPRTTIERLTRHVVPAAMDLGDRDRERSTR
jgi:alkanesulfonate monooxygenase SsuD/methylene tetrahydromethanopterin reductase-like flavin-dependent oxidoreductase (luciferase family)